MHPDAAVLFGTEFPIDQWRDQSFVLFYLVLPFGFTGPPDIFGRIMQGVQNSHRSYKSPCPEWNGGDTLSAEVFVGDGMFLEARLGGRPQISVHVL